MFLLSLFALIITEEGTLTMTALWVFPFTPLRSVAGLELT